MRILVGYDGSKAADRALQGLAHAGLPARAEAWVMAAVAPWPEAASEAWAWGQYGAYAGEIMEDAIKGAQGLADKAVRKLRAGFPAWKVEGGTSVGSPAQVLLDKADDWKPDLIVVGSHGRSGLGRLVLGSVSLRVLHHGKTDVRISRSRTGRRKAAPVRILLGMDGSTGSERALAAILARPWPEKTAIRVLAVVNWRDFPSPMLKAGSRPASEKARGDLRTWIEEKVESAAERLGRKGLEASQDVLLGDPRRVIPREAGTWKADCVFVGSRGLNAVDRFLIGSVSSAVAARAPCSVEVVRKEHDTIRAGSAGSPRR